MPRRPFADLTVLDFLRAKIIGDDLLLVVAPAFLDLRIIVIRLGHRRIRFSRGGETPFAKPANL